MANEELDLGIWMVRRGRLVKIECGTLVGRGGD